ncbi:MAG: cytochrome C oxidase subunit II [Chloroflexi bacterium RBG_16_57_8]|nr:MAG: cytochrome C oxidase subunit II [Chloroflexi bacterium RBG_16_57_8]
MSSLVSPQRIWWRTPLSREEKIWVAVSVLWGIFMFAMMYVWGSFGKQEVPLETYRVAPETFQAKAAAFASQYQVGAENGIPVVRPPPGSDAYLVARIWQWDPILELKKGATYRLHTSSVDLQHGFSLQPGNINIQVLPGYDYVMTITPDKAGEYQIVCNEYCGPGHHLMVGKIVVTE